ncbi:MAG: hypothetical protein LBS17_02755 [Actinomycetes bacterium]|jgi:hypothetical protein|nr:hypothetical protein [Actinomycetes bacterium]
MNIKTGKLRIGVVVACAVCLLLVLPALAAAVTGPAITLTGSTTFTVPAVKPAIKVPFTIAAVPNATYSGRTVYIQPYKMLAGGGWEKVDSHAYFSGTLGGAITDAIDILDSNYDELPSGTYTFKLVVEAHNYNGVAYEESSSANFTVNVTRMPTTFTIGSVQHVGTYYATTYLYITNTAYFELKKTVSVTWPDFEGDGDVLLQRLDGGKWVTIATRSTYSSYSSNVQALEIKIQQPTAAKTSYRLYVAPTAYVSGGASPVFTVTGVKQTPTLTVKYSKSSQKYKKTQVKMTIKLGKATKGKLTIYDGKKVLKNITVKTGGQATYYLPKKLKKGTHKIKVKLTPMYEYKELFNTKTSSVKKIKVK